MWCTFHLASPTQGTGALSTGESEWYALVHAAACGIGLASLACDMGYGMELRLAGNATAAGGIAICVCNVWCRRRRRRRRNLTLRQ